MRSRVLELFGIPVASRTKPVKWPDVVAKQYCPYLGRTCLKNRKSQPDIAIGTCSLRYGREGRGILICPHRLLERRQIFTDSLHLLTLHEPGNELHVVPEVTLPGGSIDYVLASVESNRVVDFVGIELQTLDTTGTVWPERQRLLKALGIEVSTRDVASKKTFGMNWKMTAKTILVQLHHKVGTFEALSKHLVLVMQDHFLSYVKQAFSFGHVSSARLGDPMHFHAYALRTERDGFRLQLVDRLSTDADGIATCLGLEADANMKLEELLALIQSKVSESTRMTV